VQHLGPLANTIGDQIERQPMEPENPVPPAGH
jgi:hypothetical protein